MTPQDQAPAAVEPIAAETNDWADQMALLRRRYPDATDGVLFCVFKLQSNHNLGLRDFRDEAALHGIRLSGRSLHSGRVLLGLERAPARRAKTDPPSAPATGKVGTLEERLIGTIQSIQERATEQTQKLRDAMQQAINVLQRALRDD